VADAQLLPFPSNRERDARESRPEPRLREVFGEVLRDERTEQGRTLSEVAERAAVSLPYLSEVERGRKDVSSDVLASICAALELPLPTLLDRAAHRLATRATAGTTTFALAA
jgi:ribosome-binding protein aMBF1 (putative translation factor)